MSSDKQTKVPGDLRQVIPVRVARPTHACPVTPRLGEPVTAGVPLPPGFAATESQLLLHRNGQQVPLQTRALDRWADGSIRWTLLDFQANVGAHDAATFHLSSGNGTPVSLTESISVRRRGKSLVVDTGAALFILREGGRFPVHQVLVGGQSVIDRQGVRLEIDSAAGRPCLTELQHVDVEESGPLRTVVRIMGTVREPGQPPLLELAARVHFFAGSAAIRVALTLRNPRPAQHPGGLWDLGDPASVYVTDVSVRVSLRPASSPAIATCSATPDDPQTHWAMPFQLYQDSSGGAHWDSSNHVNRHGIVATTFRGYRLRAPSTERRGLRATPILTLTRGAHQVATGMEHFWQNCPKIVEAAGDTIRLGLFPAEYSDVHEIQGGEQKTHVFMLSFATDRVSGGTFAWWRDPLVVTLAPADYAAARAMRYLTPAADDRHTVYLQLVSEALDGHDSFEQKREAIDEYGWRHFGDIYGDHEAAHHSGLQPLVSHCNNQYDAIAGFAVQFMRTADARWARHMRELAAHVVDIDIYHTTGDKTVYNHGLFWHTFHYTDAGRATHRSYPSGAGLPGGGPSCEHNYATGLMLCYFLTGDEMLREAALELAQFAIDIDDGAKNILGWVHAGPTGLATASGSFDYHGPGRGAANSVEALLTGYRLSGDSRFLTKADEIIRRCIHPEDDIASHNLLDTERKWFYTMFLQALGRYLDEKVDRGELDAMYAYGRAALLHYARWMADHEFPYLDKPEKLEFPTETWAAQDMRKSDVFKYALAHATGSERARFWERADFFFRYSTKALAAMPTRTRARPTVLMLTLGHMHEYFQQHPETSAPEPRWAGHFPTRVPFVRQKVVVKRRVVTMAIVSLLVAAAFVLA